MRQDRENHGRLGSGFAAGAGLAAAVGLVAAAGTVGADTQLMDPIALGPYWTYEVGVGAEWAAVNGR